MEITTNVVLEIVVKSIGELTIKHLFFHAFNLVFRNQSSAFSRFLSSKKGKKKEKKRNLPL